MVDWLARRWVASALFMACGFIALAPAIAVSFSAFLTLIYLHIPIYMFHQFEEHSGDRFRSFANDRMFGGKEVMRPVDIIIVNLPAVWGVNLIAFYAAAFVAPGLGLVAPYLLLVNAVLHIVTTLRLRCYNPGLVTAILLFLPLSIAALIVAANMPEVTLGYHALGLAFAIAIHIAIMAQAGWRYRHMAAAAEG
ncbi:HXXEE domain-containing protein [Martelella endophytica]|uniref:HXXEE domain-containing protein n=1 Tax=Martelella endophytica TaxID=1486262 RepID=A0A0D5LWM3_MAREN|nr:HXXEE domain-containing protein [Martelella endophytica]AJY47813.1 hypothetical protein TM49_00230 [Martelella endophytica]